MNDSAIVKAARAVYQGLPEDLRHDVDEFLAGVFLGSAPQLESHIDALYEAYAPVRKLMHGSGVTLYRGEPKDRPALKRKFLSWTPSWKLANHFATTRGHVIVEAEVRTSDVVAVFVSPTNTRYVEYLVRDRKEYHEKESDEQIPLYGRIEHDHLGRDLGWEGANWATMGEFLPDRVRAERPHLERALHAVGGALLNLYINEEDEGAVASVVIPSSVKTVEIADDLKAEVGPYLVNDLRPYLGRWSPKSRRGAEEQRTAARVMARFAKQSSSAK